MEIRVNDGSVEITGYVNAVGRKSQPIADAEGYFTETIQPGAFARALRDNPNVPMLLNHDTNRVIARGDALDLREDNVGLHVRATVTDPEVVEKARTNQLRGWSFGFTPTQQQNDAPEGGGIRHRDVYGMRLAEISLLDMSRTPAYAATSVYTRDAGDAVQYRDLEDTVEVHEKPQPPDLPAPIELLEVPE